MIENAGWLFHFVRGMVESDYEAEEAVQETFYNAYKHFAGYSEQGKLRAWLKAIARNIVYKAYNDGCGVVCISFDADDNLLRVMASGEPPPEANIMRQELIGEILQLVANLPTQQRLIVTYRYTHNLSILETSRLMGLPPGTVKSNASYGLKTLRRQLGITKGEMKMKKCADYYGLLFEYAKGYLTKEERKAVEEHTASCKACTEIISGLAAVWPYLQQEFGNSDYKNYFNIAFQAGNGRLSYTGACEEMPKEQVAIFNKILDENNGKIPEEMVGGMGPWHNTEAKHLSFYTNNGSKMEFKTIQESAARSRSIVTAIPQIYETQWYYSTFLWEHSPMIKQSKAAPTLYEAHNLNNLGQAAKCGMFMHIPKSATNIRIKKGSGVLEREGQIFAYSQRFTAENESIDLAFTFNM